MLKNCQFFILTGKNIEDIKTLCRKDDVREFFEYVKRVINMAHSGEYSTFTIKCHLNPDGNMIYDKPAIIMDMEDIILPFAANESLDKINELKISISKNGLIVPLSVDNNNKLLDGHHRYMALKELGIKKVKVVKYGKIEKCTK